jgi:hypothetical protein
MASPQDLLTVYKMGFAPLDLVDVPVGHITVKLYPKIVPAMLVHERAHAFQVNKAVLKDLPTDQRLVTDALGAQLNASSTVEGILSDWRRYFNKHWMAFNFLTILSFHDLQGACIDNTTIAGNPQVLKPVQNGVVGASRSQDVWFVCVQCTLDFGPLTTVNPYPVSLILRESYYTELPQSSRAMTNGAGGAYTLIIYCSGGRPPHTEPKKSQDADLAPRSPDRSSPATSLRFQPPSGKYQLSGYPAEC